MKKTISDLKNDYNYNDNYINNKQEINNDEAKLTIKIPPNIPLIKSRNGNNGAFDAFKPHKKYKSLGMKFSH